MPKTRLFEPNKTGGADSAPFNSSLNPNFDLANIITEPDQLYGLYRGQFKCSGYICFISSLGSLAFEAILPFQIGQYVLNVIQKDAGTIDQDQYDNKMNDIITWVSATFAVSAICGWLSQYIAASNSAKMGKQLRYDIYFCYFKKLRQQLMSSNQRLKLEINEKESKKAFNFANINQEITIFQEDMQHHRPKRTRALLLILISYCFLLFTSWQLTLFATGGLLLIGLINFIIFVVSNKDISYEGLSKIVYNSFKMGPSDFTSTLNRFDDNNEEIYAKTKKMACFNSGRSMFSSMMVNAYWVLMVWYVKKMYEGGRDDTDKDTNFANATISVDQIFVCVFYTVEIVRQAAVLGSADSKEHKKKMAHAESELYSAVKMQPVMTFKKAEMSSADGGHDNLATYKEVRAAGSMASTSAAPGAWGNRKDNPMSGRTTNT